MLTTLARLSRRASYRPAAAAMQGCRKQQHCSASSSSASEQTRAPVLAFADGASRGNPGKSGCGALLIDASTKQVIASGTSYLGDQETNNSAEYKGLLLVLHLAQTHNVTNVHIHMDSELIIRQMQGIYRVKAPNLRGLYEECRRLCDGLENVQFSHVRREDNADADRLANEAIDTHEKQQLLARLVQAGNEKSG